MVLALNLNGAVFGKITNGIYSCPKYSLPVLNATRDYDDKNYIFQVVLTFDKMHRPSIALKGGIYPTPIKGDVVDNYFITNHISLGDHARADIIAMMLDDTSRETYLVKHNNLLTEVLQSFNCSLEYIDGAWCLELKSPR